jgi:hypothetical protein
VRIRELPSPAQQSGCRGAGRTVETLKTENCASNRQTFSYVVLGLPELRQSQPGFKIALHSYSQRRHKPGGLNVPTAGSPSTTPISTLLVSLAARSLYQSNSGCFPARKSCISSPSRSRPQPSRPCLLVKAMVRCDLDRAGL